VRVEVLLEGTRAQNVATSPPVQGPLRAFVPSFNISHNHAQWSPRSATRLQLYARPFLASGAYRGPASAAFGDLELGRDRSALLAARPDNIVLVTASWWVNR